MRKQKWRKEIFGTSENFYFVNIQQWEIFGTSENYHRMLVSGNCYSRNFWNFQKFPQDDSFRKFSEVPKISTRNESAKFVLFPCGKIFVENRRTTDRRTVDGRMRQYRKQIRIRIDIGRQTGAFGHYDALPD